MLNCLLLGSSTYRAQSVEISCSEVFWPKKIMGKLCEDFHKSMPTQCVRHGLFYIRPKRQHSNFASVYGGQCHLSKDILFRFRWMAPRLENCHTVYSNIEICCLLIQFCVSITENHISNTNFQCGANHKLSSLRWTNERTNDELESNFISRFPN